MHKRVVLNFEKFKSRKCSISFSRDYARKGQENKKALKNQGFSWLYLFYSPFLVASGRYFLFIVYLRRMASGYLLFVGLTRRITQCLTPTFVAFGF